MIDLELLQHAVLDSRDGITIADAQAEDLPLIFVNPAFERMTGYSHDEVVGRNCRFLQRGRTEDALGAQMRDALDQGQGFSHVIMNYRKDDTPFWNELSVSPIHNEHGTVTHFIGFQKDVTQRMLLDEQLRARNRDLESAKKALEERMRRLKEMKSKSKTINTEKKKSKWGFLKKAQNGKRLISLKS